MPVLLASYCGAARLKIAQLLNTLLSSSSVCLFSTVKAKKMHLRILYLTILYKTGLPQDVVKVFDQDVQAVPSQINSIVPFSESADCVIEELVWPRLHHDVCF